MKRKLLCQVCGQVGYRTRRGRSGALELPSGWSEQGAVRCSGCVAADRQPQPVKVWWPRSRRSMAKRRALIAAMLRKDPTRSNNSIAKQIGTYQSLVAGRRRELEAAGSIPVVSRTVGLDGKARPARLAP